MKQGQKGHGSEATKEHVVKLQPKPRGADRKRRIAWNGRRRRSGPSEPLLAALMRQANDNGQTLTELGAALGVTYGYLAQLNSGWRKVEHISLQFAESCARYLGVPTLTVKVLARQVRLEDFVLPAELERPNIEAGLRRLADDPLLGGFMPASLHKQDVELQAFVLMLYQEATGVELFAFSRLPEVIEAAKAAASALSKARGAEVAQV